MCSSLYDYQAKASRYMKGLAYLKNRATTGVPVMVQWKQIRLVTVRLWAWSLASPSGLRIWYCPELWCRSQLGLGSCDAVAVASSCSSDLTPSLGISICHTWGQERWEGREGRREGGRQRNKRDPTKREGRKEPDCGKETKRGGHREVQKWYQKRSAYREKRSRETEPRMGKEGVGSRAAAVWRGQCGD